MSGTQMPFAVTGEVTRDIRSGSELWQGPSQDAPAPVRTPELGRNYDLTPATAALILRRHWTSQRVRRLIE